MSPIPDQEAPPSMAAIKPSWGAFPVEQYLLRNWDSASGETPDQRRQTLDDFQRPTGEEIETILLPWREQRLRELAAVIFTANREYKAVWLRTHYDESKESAQKLQAWIDEDEDCDPHSMGDELLKTVLDDPSYFNFGNDWQRVFCVIPEIAGLSEWTRQTENDEFREQLRVKLRENIANSPTPAEEYLTYDYEAIQLQAISVDYYLLVADSQAFESNLLKVIFMDSKGNVIRHSRVPADRIWEVAQEYRDKWRLWDSEFFIGKEPIGETNLGEKYLLYGEIGRDLYG